MKITVYSNQFWPAIGGVESGSRLLARSLSAEGHRVTVFTSTLYSGHELNEEYRIVRSKSFLAFLRTIAHEDLMLMKGGVSAFAGLGAMLAHVPRVVIWHEMAGPYGHPGTSWTVRIMNMLRKRIAKLASVHVGLTHTCLNSKNLPRALPQRVIPTPVDEYLLGGSCSSELLDKQIDVLFVGRLAIGKGILVLAEALRLLSSEDHPISVRIVGEGDDRSQLESQLQSSQKMSVTFTGSQTGNELKESYELSKILVVPSTTHPEGQAIVVAEGMAFGLPVIVSDQAVLQEVVGDAGITVPQGNAEALAAAIRKLLSDRNYWKALSERSQERSEYFSMLCFRQSISDLIKDVADYDKSKLAEVRRC